MMTAILGQEPPPNRGVIEGFVTDRMDAPIAGARVAIVRSATNDVIALRTGEMGQFLARNLPMGAYLVVVEKEGYRSGRMPNVVLEPQSDSPDEFRSRYLALFRLDPQPSR